MNMKHPSLAALTDLLELKQAITHHCTAIRATVLLLEQGKTEAAAARLEGAVASLEQALRGQCSSFSMPCPSCGSEQGLEAWVDARKCGSCGEYLDATADL